MILSMKGFKEKAFTAIQSSNPHLSTVLPFLCTLSAYLSFSNDFTIKKKYVFLLLPLYVKRVQYIHCSEA